MHTCSKKYTDIPFAHRQHNHKGHCKYIHGHNWSFKLTFAADERDENNFVVDFGKLKPLKQWLGALDHALVLNEDDPMLPFFQQELGGSSDLAKIVVVDDASCEGMAELVFIVADKLAKQITDGRARCVLCEAEEDSRNSASYSNLPQE